MFIVLALIILFGAILRWWQLDIPSYWMDESFSVAMAQNWNWVDGWMRSPLYHSCLYIVGAVSGWNIWWLRSLSVVFGLGMVAAGYFTVKRWFEEPVALGFATLLSMSTLEVAWSRQVRMYLLLQLCFWLALYTYHQWRAGKLHWFWPSLFCVFTVLSHEFGLVLPLVFFWFECLRRFKRWRVITILASLVCAYIGAQFILPNLPTVNYWWHYWYWMLINYGMLLPLAVLGVWQQRSRIQLMEWLVATWLGWVWCLSFIVPLLQYRYLMLTFPIVLLFAVLGGYWLWQQGWIGKCLLAACVGAMIWQQQVTVLPKSFYQLESDAVTAPFSYKSFTPQPDFKSAYQFVDEYLIEHPETRVVDAYPALHRIYRGVLPDAALFLNLTGGTYVTTPLAERYTQLEHLTFTQLEQWKQEGQVLVLVDGFAAYRTGSAIKSMLISAEVVWESNQEPWSNITVYRIQSDAKELVDN